ncbi:MAG: carotenoid 1,2-hydratase [Deltaproteobacteria bacterium]|nr:carotenoid 1,2-hydratase [Deltaproteobacteria bacterium]
MRFAVWLWLIGFCVAVPCRVFPTASGFERALPGRSFSFPRDHGSHPRFQTEWWYYTGHLRSQGGKPFGYQLTFFRRALRPGRPSGESRWAIDSVYFAHFALTDEKAKDFMFRERISRGALGQAGAATGRLHVWIGDWSLRAEGAAHLLEAGSPTMGIRLRLVPTKPPVVNGINGVSRKAEGEGNASYYYSMTRMNTQGDLVLNGKDMKVTGVSWMDHEFGSNQLQEYQVGWDWFSLQLENNTELMLYLIRDRSGKPDPYSSGTLTFPDGSSHHLSLQEFDVRALETWKSRKTGARYPSGWRIRVPLWKIDLTVRPTVPHQELDPRQSTRIPYWEGSVHVRGRYGKSPVSGVGYVELTGYARPMNRI